MSHAVGHAVGHAVNHVVGHALLPSTSLEMSHYDRLISDNRRRCRPEWRWTSCWTEQSVDAGTADVVALSGVVRVVDDGRPGIVVEVCLTWCNVR